VPISLRHLWGQDVVNCARTKCVQSSFMLRPTVSRPVSLGIKHPSGAHDQIFITVRQLQVCLRWALSLTREDGSVVYNYCWPSPEQSFSGPGPAGLETMFYCLRFETSLLSPLTTRRTTVEIFCFEVLKF
jgi:hypothetical protein